MSTLYIGRFGKFFRRHARAHRTWPALVAVFVSCAHGVTVKTEPPGARVRIVAENGKPGTPLGTTPLALDALSTSGVTLVELEKEGHLPQFLVLPKVSGAAITVTTRLQPLSREYFAEKNRRDFAASLNINLAQIFQLQALILKRKKEEVNKLAATMQEQWDEVSLFHSLMGNHLYLNGSFKEARVHYEKALILDPNNAEARAMLANLR